VRRAVGEGSFESGEIFSSSVQMEKAINIEAGTEIQNKLLDQIGQKFLSGSKSIFPVQSYSSLMMTTNGL